MSAIIHHFVVHQLTVNEQQQLSLVAKENCFDVTPAIEDFAQQLNHAFNSKPGKGVGGFVVEAPSEENVSAPVATEDGEDSEALTAPLVFRGEEFKSALANMLNNPDEFAEFSRKSSEILKQTLVDFGTIETGFVIFSHFNYLATDYLMITLLNTKEHVEITSQLELNQSVHLDLAKMQLAVRLDLTQYKINPETNRYVSFIKGRMGRKVSDFFMAFIGCEELVDVKQQNKQLLSTVDSYLAAEQLDPEEKLQSRSVVADYYKEKLEMGEDIQLRELADKLPKDEGTPDFYDFARGGEQELEEHFQADRGALKTLAKFSGQGGGISLSFERKLFNERVHYNADTDTLVIKGIPPNLRDQIVKS